MDFLDQIKQGADGPNKVPNNFFSQFPEKMMERVLWEEELKDIAPLLTTISRKPVHFIPEGYFEQFIASSKKEEAKVIAMPGWRKMVSYAAAAAMAGVLVTGAYFYTDTKSAKSFDMAFYNTIDVSAELNKLPEDALQQYLSANAVGGAGHELNTEMIETNSATSVENVSDEELMNYLNEAGEKPAPTKS